MDKFTKSLISILVILFVFITFIVFFGGYAYEIKGILKQVTAPQEYKTQKISGINFQPYMDEMQVRMKKVWKPADTSKSAKIETAYKIMKNGEISDIRIINSNAGEANDESVKEALQKVSPLPPLPLSYKSDSIEVNFTFEINNKAQKNE